MLGRPASERQGLPPGQFQIGRVINQEPMPGGKLGDGEQSLLMRFFVDGQAQPDE